LTVGLVFGWKSTEYTIWNPVIIIATFVIGIVTFFLIAKATNPKLNVIDAIFDIFTKF
jgi:hypothetical protein